MKEHTTAAPEYITTDELADRCRTSPETVRYWRHVGKGPASFKLGRRVLYAAVDVDAWIKARRAADITPESVA